RLTTSLSYKLHVPPVGKFSKATNMPNGLHQIYPVIWQGDDALALYFAQEGDPEIQEPDFNHWRLEVLIRKFLKLFLDLEHGHPCYMYLSNNGVINVSVIVHQFAIK